MREKERQLRSNIAKIVADSRAILDRAEREKRKLTGDEETTYRNLDMALDKADRELQLYLKDSTIDPEEVRSAGVKNILYGNETVNAGPRYIDDSAPEFRDTRYVTPELRTAFRTYLRQGVNAISNTEYRALQADADAMGGFLVMPLALADTIIKKMDNEVFIRKLATVYRAPRSESLGVPALDNDPGDPTWTAEIGTVNEDSTMSFGARELTPHPIARLIKVSAKLLRASYIDAESLVTDRLIYKFGTVQENAFLNGTGAGQPMGVFTTAQSGFGITTARDVSTGNTQTAVTVDGLIEAFYSLKAQYRKKATWIINRTVLKAIRKLKDGEGQYIWQPGFATNRPDTILSAPYVESEYAPNTMTAGKYVGIVGDFSNYWIVDALDIGIQRLIELYAANNQVGFIGRQELDGMPVIDEGFARVQLAP